MPEPESFVINISSDGSCELQKRDDSRCSLKVAVVRILIGSVPDLSFIDGIDLEKQRHRQQAHFRPKSLDTTTSKSTSIKAQTVM